MSLENKIRIGVFCAGAYAALALPFWVPAVAIVLLALRFRAWEALVLALFVEFLWLPAGHLPYYLLATICIVWFFEPLRSRFLAE